MPEHECKVVIHLALLAQLEQGGFTRSKVKELNNELHDLSLLLALASLALLEEIEFIARTRPGGRGVDYVCRKKGLLRWERRRGAARTGVGRSSRGGGPAGVDVVAAAAAAAKMGPKRGVLHVVAVVDRRRRERRGRRYEGHEPAEGDGEDGGVGRAIGWSRRVRIERGE